VSYASYGVDLPERLALDSGSEGIGQPVRLVYAGRFERGQKRIELLPPLLAALDRRAVSWTLEIAGAGPEAEALRAELGRYGERVAWRGALSPERTHDELLRSGRVLVLTSRWELGPVVAWEAMARGLVVVAPRFVGSGLEGALRDGDTALLYAPGDIEEAASRIASLANEALRTGIATSARAEAARRYSRPVAAAAWDQLLTTTLATPERPVAPAPASLPSGRLERWFGAALAESVRSLLGRRIAHADSGSEWPHTLGGGLTESEFFARLERIDRSTPGTVG
jgi:glycosyltransferase involved in cell wall biosynthesis